MSPPPQKPIQFESPAEWVTLRELDLDYRAPGGSPESILLIDHQHHADEHACYTRVARRVHSMAAVQQAAQWRCDFDPKTQRLVIHSLAVLRDGMRFEQAKESSVRTLQREENLERFMLDGAMTAIALLEDVRGDDIIDVSWTIYSKPRVLPEYHFSVAAIPTSGFVRIFSVSVRFGAAKPMWWKTDSTKVQLEERSLPNGNHEWSWKVERFSPREPEPQMPPWFFQGRIIQFSNVPDWGAVSRGLHAAWCEDFEHPALCETVTKIAAHPSVEERVEAALRFVQDEIRYLSVNTELGGHIPANPGDVLKRRFGDCKDKAFLLAHLLRRLGVSARAVLVNASIQGKVREFLPMLTAFNHAIVEFEWQGQRRWVDATISMQGGGPGARYLPPYAVGLPIGVDARDLEELPVDQGVQSHYRLRESFRLESPETLLLTVVTEVTGRHADELRFRDANEGPAASARHREERYRSIFSSTQRRADAIFREDRLKNSCAIVETFVLPGLVVATNEPGVAGFQFPLHLIHSALAFPDTDQRKYPLALPYPFSIEQIVECEFRTLGARGTGLVDIRGKQFTLNVKVNSRPASYAWSLRYTTSGDHVPAVDYPVHRQKVREAFGMLILAILVPTGARSTSPRRPLDDLLPSWTRNATPTAISESEPAAEPALAAALTSLPPQAARKRADHAPVPQGLPPRTSRTTLQTSPTPQQIARNVSVGLFFLYVLIRMVWQAIEAMK